MWSCRAPPLKPRRTPCADLVVRSPNSEPSTSSREATFSEAQAATGGDFVHPYNDPRVIAGQGTCSTEFMEQTNRLDMVVAPIGGGGMISGTCLTLATLAPDARVIAAEPEQADDAYRCVALSRLCPTAKANATQRTWLPVPVFWRANTFRTDF